MNCQKRVEKLRTQVTQLTEEFDAENTRAVNLGHEVHDLEAQVAALTDIVRDVAVVDWMDKNALEALAERADAALAQLPTSLLDLKAQYEQAEAAGILTPDEPTPYGHALAQHPGDRPGQRQGSGMPGDDEPAMPFPRASTKDELFAEPATCPTCGSDVPEKGCGKGIYATSHDPWHDGHTPDDGCDGG